MAPIGSRLFQASPSAAHIDAAGGHGGNTRHGLLLPSSARATLTREHAGQSHPAALRRGPEPGSAIQRSTRTRPWLPCKPTSPRDLPTMLSRCWTRRSGACGRWSDCRSRAWLSRFGKILSGRPCRSTCPICTVGERAFVAAEGILPGTGGPSQRTIVAACTSRCRTALGRALRARRARGSCHVLAVQAPQCGPVVACGGAAAAHSRRPHRWLQRRNHCPRAPTPEGSRSLEAVRRYHRRARDVDRPCAR